MVNPMALAVLRLTTSSYLVGNWTGRSAHLGTAEQAIDVGRGAAILVGDIRPIREQAARGCEFPFGVDGRQPMLCRQPDDRIAVWADDRRGHARTK
jgi:hypothetical protein